MSRPDGPSMRESRAVTARAVADAATARAAARAAAAAARAAEREEREASTPGAVRARRAAARRAEIQDLRTMGEALVPDLSGVPSNELLQDTAEAVIHGASTTAAALGRLAAGIAAAVRRVTGDGDTVVVLGEGDLAADDSIHLLVTTLVEALVDGAEAALDLSATDGVSTAGRADDEGRTNEAPDVAAASAVAAGLSLAVAAIPPILHLLSHQHRITIAPGGADEGHLLAAVAGALLADGDDDLPRPARILLAGSRTVPRDVAIVGRVTELRGLHRQLGDRLSAASAEVERDRVTMLAIEAAMELSQAELERAGAARRANGDGGDELERTAAAIDEQRRALAELELRVSSAEVAVTTLTELLASIDEALTTILAAEAGQPSPLAVAALQEVVHSPGPSRTLLLHLRGQRSEAVQQLRQPRPATGGFETFVTAIAAYTLVDAVTGVVRASDLARGEARVRGGFATIGELQQDHQVQGP